MKRLRSDAAARAAAAAPIPSDKLAYSVDEASTTSSLSPRKLYTDIAAGRLVARRLGGRTIILAGDLAAYLEAAPELRSAT